MILLIDRFEHQNISLFCLCCLNSSWHKLSFLSGESTALELPELNSTLEVTMCTSQCVGHFAQIKSERCSGGVPAFLHPGKSLPKLHPGCRKAVLIRNNCGDMVTSLQLFPSYALPFLLLWGGRLWQWLWSSLKGFSFHLPSPLL